MRINAEFSQSVVIRPEDYRWVDSPTQGVERMMLDRIERARIARSLGAGYGMEGARARRR
jgi:hypothetical protein